MFLVRLLMGHGEGAPRHAAGMDTDDVLANLAWGPIRDCRRRRDVDPVIRWEWIRLFVGVIRRARRGRAEGVERSG